MSNHTERMFPDPEVLLWVKNEATIEVGSGKDSIKAHLMLDRDIFYADSENRYALTITVYNFGHVGCGIVEAVELALAKFEMPTVAELAEMDLERNSANAERKLAGNSAGKTDNRAVDDENLGLLSTSWLLEMADDDEEHLLEDEELTFRVAVAQRDFEKIYDRLRNSALATKCKFRYRSIRLPFHASPVLAFMVFHAREYADDRPGPVSQVEARAAFKEVYPDVADTTRIRLAIDMDTNVYAIEDNPEESGPCRCVMLGHKDFGVSTDMMEFEYDSDEECPHLVAGDQDFGKGYSEMDVRWRKGSLRERQ